MRQSPAKAAKSVGSSPLPLEQRFHASFSSLSPQSAALLSDQKDFDSRVPLLDKRFAVPSRWPRYLPQDNDRDDLLSLWVASLSKLLRAKVGPFWSTVLYDVDLHSFLDSYLRYASRPWERPMGFAVNPLRPKIAASVLRLIIRVSNPSDPKPLKASGEVPETLSAAFHAALLLNAEDSALPATLCAPPSPGIVPIFDVSRVLDLCSLFGGSYPDIIRDLIKRLFSVTLLTSNFSDEVRTAVIASVTALSKISQVRTAVIASVTALSKISQELKPIGLNKTPSALSADSAQYVVDILRSWYSLVHVSDSVLRICLNEQLLVHVGLAYEILAGNLVSVKDGCLLLASDLFSELFEIIRSSSTDDANDAFYLAFMRLIEIGAVASDLKYFVPEGTSFGSFLRDANTYCNLTALLQTVKLDMKQGRITGFEETQIDYILSALQPSSNSFSSSSPNHFFELPKPLEPGCPDFASVEMASLISQVSEIIGATLSEGNIALLLYHFGGKVEPTINAALENVIPETLKSFSQKLTLNELIEMTLSGQEGKQGKDLNSKFALLDSRQSIFNDEFSLANSTPFDDRWKLKRSGRQVDDEEERQLRSILNDRSDVKKFRNRYNDELFDVPDDGDEDVQDSGSNPKGNASAKNRKLKESGGILYDDEPDDSLDSFVRLNIADGEESDPEDPKGYDDEDNSEGSNNNEFGIPSNKNRPQTFGHEDDEGEDGGSIRGQTNARGSGRGGAQSSFGRGRGGPHPQSHSNPQSQSHSNLKSNPSSRDESSSSSQRGGRGSDGRGSGQGRGGGPGTHEGRGGSGRGDHGGGRGGGSGHGDQSQGRGDSTQGHSGQGQGRGGRGQGRGDNNQDHGQGRAGGSSGRGGPLPSSQPVAQGDPKPMIRFDEDDDDEAPQQQHQGGGGGGPRGGTGARGRGIGGGPGGRGRGNKDHGQRDRSIKKRGQ